MRRTCAMGLSAGLAVGVVLGATGRWLRAQNTPGSATPRCGTNRM